MPWTQGSASIRPASGGGGYRYGPSMILNADGSIDIWCATDGPGDISDMVNAAA